LEVDPVGWSLAADSAGTQRPDMVADLFQCGRERGELGWGEVLDEVFLDAAVVHVSCVLERVASGRCDEHLDHPSVLWGPLAAYEAVGFHAVDHTDLALLTLSVGSLATVRSPDKHGSKLTIAPLVGRS
jgi:hypothetical protein